MSASLRVSLMEVEDLLVIPLGEERTFSFPVDGKTAVLTAGLHQVSSLSSPRAGLLKHWQVVMALNAPYESFALHPKCIWVETDEPLADALIEKHFSTDTSSLSSTPTIVLGESGSQRVYGLRDAAFMEPSSLIAMGGKVAFVLLGNRPPRNGYPPYYAPWKGQLDGSLGEDSLSTEAHRWQGGFGRVWDLFITEPEGVRWIQEDPAPDLQDPRLHILAGLIPPAQKGPRAGRHNPILRSYSDLTTAHGQHGYFWHLFQGAARMNYWNPSSGMFPINPKAFNIGWKSWPNQPWGDGLWNFQYDEFVALVRLYMEAPTKQLWLYICRAARWVGWSMVCHTASKKGWHWGEKNSRSTQEVGQYPGEEIRSYKQNTRSALLCAALFPHFPWAVKAAQAHLDALPNMGYESFDGNWGSRIIWRGIRAYCAAFQYTGDPVWKTRALALCERARGVMRDPVRMALELDTEWKDPELGLPYISNGASSPPHHFAVWEIGKSALALFDVVQMIGLLSPELPAWIPRKLDQIALFVVRHCLNHDATAIRPVYLMTPDRKKFTSNGVNFMEPIGNSTLVWLLPAIGWGVGRGDQECVEVWPQVSEDAYQLTDWNGSGNRPDPNRPFDWSNGAHFNSWVKEMAPINMVGDLPAVVNKIREKT